MTTILLDNSLDKTALLFQKPRAIIKACDADAVDAALKQIEAAVQDGYHAAGFFSYELGYVFAEKLRAVMPKGRKLPLLWFGVFDPPQKFEEGETFKWLKDQSNEGFSLNDFTADMDKESYKERFQKVKNHIKEGDLYQLNLTFKSRFEFEGDVAALYQNMRQQQPVRYGAMIQTGDFDILSASPELFLNLEKNKLTTSPMKGTVGRGRWAKEDIELKNWLTSDEKSRAENLMIVDLMRNDIGRISETGSIQVSDMFDVKTFPSLHQMTTDIHAELKSGLSLSDFVKSIYPAGSITGAPKMRAQELIRELEMAPRGIYTGSIGYFKPEGEKGFSAHFNVAIRTITLTGNKGDIGIGSGVVYDSDCVDEYDECFLKMKFLTEPQPDFHLFETLKWDGARQEYSLLSEHLERLEASAQRFGFVYVRQKIESTLKNTSKKSTLPLRIKLMLFKDGNLKIEVENLSFQPEKVLRFTIAKNRVNSADHFLYHKTSQRDFFDAARAEYIVDNRYDEVIFMNENGEATEGSYTNIFVEKNSILHTPPLACGLLPGTLRTQLIKSGKAIENKLNVDDLDGLNTVYLGNSVRGLMPAVLTEEAGIKKAS